MTRLGDGGGAVRALAVQREEDRAVDVAHTEGDDARRLVPQRLVHAGNVVCPVGLRLLDVLSSRVAVRDEEDHRAGNLVTLVNQLPVARESARADHLPRRGVVGPVTCLEGGYLR